MKREGRNKLAFAVLAAMIAVAAAAGTGCAGRGRPPVVMLQMGRTADELTRPPTLRHVPTEAETPAETEGEEAGIPDEAIPSAGMGDAAETAGEPGKPGVPVEGMDGATAPDMVIEVERDLIKDAGFDMIYPNFNRKTGRRDPFVPVSVHEADWEALKRLAGEQFRVIGTAMTPTGQIAMISVMEQVKIVREGDILENGSVVKSISQYDVVLDREGRELRLTMFTRRRVARMESEADKLQVKSMDNINDLYKKYLEDKFGEEYEGREGEADRPDSFSDYMDQTGAGRGSGDMGNSSGGRGANELLKR